MAESTRRIYPRRSGSKALILLSGGIDSTTCLAYYLHEGLSPEALFVDYGQAGAKKESRAATLICRHFQVPLRTICLTGVIRKGAGLITGRNAFLLLTAALESNGKPGVIALGIHSGTRYADCTRYFIQRMQAIFDTYTGGALQIGVPFLRWSKGDIWALANSRNVPLSLTYSCERGLAQPCGSCDSCLDLEALRASSHHQN